MSFSKLKKTWSVISGFLFLFSVGTWIAMPDEYLVNMMVSAVSVVIISLTMLLYRKAILQFLKSDYFHHLGSNLLTVFLTASILSVFAYLSYKNDVQFDMTKQRVNSLSAQSKKVVESLDSELKMTLFAKRENWSAFLAWPKLFEASSNHISVKAVNIDLNPQEMSANNIRQNGSIKMQYKDQSVVVYAKNELAITNGILKLLRSRPINIYFSKGHGELSVMDQSLDGISVLATHIQSQNYQIKEIELAKVNDFPKDMDALVILGARAGFGQDEVEKIDQYIEQGGNLVFAYAPMFNGNFLSNLLSLFSKWGVKLNNELVVDQISKLKGADPSIPMVKNYNQNHIVTKNLKSKAIFPLTAGIEKLPVESNRIKYTSLAQTSAFPASWAESDLGSVKSGKIVFSADDRKGPIDLASTVEVYKEGTKLATNRLVFFGTSSFIVNGHQSHSANFNLFLNALSWSVGDEGIVSFNRPELKQERIFLGHAQLNFLLYSTVIVMPLMLLLTAIYHYRKRLRL